VHWEATVARLATCAIALLLATAASGCLDFTGHQATVMSVELYWDEQPGTAAFAGGTCRSAGVDTMTWSLTRVDTGKKVAGDTEPCTNGLDVLDPAPADYTLKISGNDKNGKTLWAATCKGLAVLRFDVGYSCDIDAN
jgi:hypothetical protein